MNYYYEVEALYHFCYVVDSTVVDEFLAAMQELGAVVHQINAIPCNWNYKEIHGVTNDAWGIYFN